LKEPLDHIDELIAKYLAGEASAKEKEELEGWLTLNESNRKYFNHLELLYDKSVSQAEKFEFDVDKAWNQVKNRMSKGGGSVIAMPSYWSALRVAAIVLVSIGLGFFIYQWVNQPLESATFVSENKIVRDTLPDGSFAVLNKNSCIKYSFNPSSNERSIEIEGEAFFEVKHSDEQAFIVKAGEVLIEDIGTAFNVKYSPDSPTVEVFVESGEVALYTIDDTGINLAAGETGVFNKDTRSFARLLKTDTNRIAYKTGIFTFRNADLGTIVSDLNAVYDSKIKLANDDLKHCRLNVTFRNERIEDIVEIIAETLNLKLTREGNDYVLDGSSCPD